MTEKNLAGVSSPLFGIIRMVSKSIKEHRLDKDYSSIVELCRMHQISTYVLHLIIDHELKKEPRSRLLLSGSCFSVINHTIDSTEEKLVTKPANSSKDKLRLALAIGLVVLFIEIIGCLYIIMNQTNNASPAIDDPVIVEMTSDSTTAKSPKNFTTQGHITITYKNSRDISFEYVGEINGNNVPHGKGKGIYQNGEYNGDYSDGLRHGEGEFATSDGANFYKGKFDKDFYSEGIITMSDGKYFDGTFNKGKPYDGTWYNKDRSLYCRIRKGKVIETPHR